MQPKRAILILIACFTPLFGWAQRAHELQFQIGLYTNFGVAYYDYHDEGIRHNFEWDQNYTATIYGLSWHYPINAYLEAGVFVSKSFDASLTLIEAESGAFNTVTGSSTRPDTLYAGVNELESEFFEFGVDLKVKLAPKGKIKPYLIFSSSLQKIKNYDDEDNIVSAEYQPLKEDLLNKYLIDENVFTIGYGFGISYPLKNGINLKLVEFSGKLIPGVSANLVALNSLDIRTGVSYQFNRKK